jgi:putative oxidoreductase
MTLSRTQNFLSWALQLLVAGILLQTLFFKFTGAEESKYIFSTLLGDKEAIGRIGSGVVELITAALLLYPRTAWLGALLAVCTACGAIFSHLTKLGVVVRDDGGLLFALALTVLVGGLFVLLLRRGEIPIVGQTLRPQVSA